MNFKNHRETHPLVMNRSITVSTFILHTFSQVHVTVNTKYKHCFGVKVKSKLSGWNWNLSQKKERPYYTKQQNKKQKKKTSKIRQCGEIKIKMAWFLRCDMISLRDDLFWSITDSHRDWHLTCSHQNMCYFRKILFYFGICFIYVMESTDIFYCFLLNMLLVYIVF